VNKLELNSQSIEDSFEKISDVEIDSINIGDHVKLIFKSVKTSEGFNCECMWVKVTKKGKKFKGTLANDPEILTFMKYGDVINFDRNEIVALLK
jgi:uncharacterized protein YegJ (DUF2314 family)